MNRSSAWFTAAVGALSFAAAALWVRTDRMSGESFPDWSVHNTGPSGTSLAFSYLSSIPGSGRVATLTARLDRAAIEPDAVVFRICPSRPPEGVEPTAWESPGWVSRLRSLLGRALVSDFLLAGEAEWVRGGGRLVLAVGSDYGPIRMEGLSLSEHFSKVYPILPSVTELDSSGFAGTIGGEPMRFMHAVFNVGEGTVMARRVLGDGEVVVLAAPWILSNSMVTQEPHLALLAGLADSGRPVYFDEHAHGLGVKLGSLGLIRAWGLGPAALVGMLLATAAFWRARARLGPPEDDHRETRVEAIEFVDSLAQLYSRALRRREAVQLYAEGLARAVRASTGLRGDALKRRVEEIAPCLESCLRHGSEEIGAGDFQKALAEINRAFDRLEDWRHRNV